MTDQPEEKKEADKKKEIQTQQTDKKGWRRYRVGSHIFEIPDRYQLLELVGQGAFGCVCSAKTLDENNQEVKVAIKKVLIPDDNILEAKRIVRELYLLQHFDHENIIGLLDVLEPAREGEFDAIYLVCDLMDTDLHRVIRSRQRLSEEHAQFFLIQMLRGVKVIHAANVLHRDLKPSNLVVNANCDLKICDFGLAREVFPETEMTDYVATRWYRAPELLLQWRSYSGAVDAWSIGCIFAELLARRPLFPGKNYLDQLHLILDVVGSPDDAEMEGIGSEKARSYLKQLPKKKRKDLRKLFKDASDAAVDLLDKLLQFDPHQRLTVEEALQHPYLQGVYTDPEEEEPVEPFEFGIDLSEDSLSLFDLKKLLFRQIVAYHPEYKNWKWWADEEYAQHQAQQKAAQAAATT